MKTNTFNSYTFGCRVNESETMALDNLLKHAGCTKTNENPSFCIINSCAVTGKAEKEVRQCISRIKKQYPHTTLILTGCAATYWIQNSIRVPGVDQIIHNADKYTIVDIVMKECNRRISSESQNIVDRNITDRLLQSGRLMVKIQEGCERYCTYCIVPFLRGKPATNTIQSIIELIQSYGPKIKEVVLTAVNTEYFGVTTQETLMGLVESIWNHTDVRVGFGSIHPWSLNNEFLLWYEKYSSHERFVHYFHIPIQSGSQDTLKRMNRRYDIQKIIQCIERIKRANSNAQIGTDIIVGFPGETEKEFQETFFMIQNSLIDRIHVFRYSPRVGTSAFIAGKRWGEVGCAIAKHRSQLLRRIGQDKYHQFLTSQVGRTVQALILKEKTDGMIQALGDNYLPIRLLHIKKASGTFCKVIITNVKSSYCVGKIPHNK